MTNCSLDLAGVFPPVTTAFNSNESINLKCFGQNLKKWYRHDFRGLLMFGSNGEFPLLSWEEKQILLQCAKDELPDGKILLAGAGCEGATLTIDLCTKFAQIGADAALIYTPCFYKGKMTPSTIADYYKKLPIILYNVPANTGVEMDAATVINLSAHPNIIGLKDSGGNVAKLAEIIEATAAKRNFQVLAGSASFLVDAMHCGCVGGICAIANVLPLETIRMSVMVKNGQLKEAQDLQARITGPNVAVTRKFGVPALKHMLDRFGFYGGPSRSPLVPLTEDERIFVEDEFEKAGFKLEIWKN